MEPPEKIILKNHLSPGDLVMLSAAVRDLHSSHPGKFLTKMDTSCQQLWENNPHVSDFPDEEASRSIDCAYPLIHRSNQSPYHFVHGFRKDLQEQMGINIRQGAMKGDIYISNKEKGWMSQVEEMGVKGKFWIVIAGGKLDFTAKIWSPQYYQEVVDHFKNKITFVQCGGRGHFHPPLGGENVISLVGKTDIRQFVRLMYHAVGVLCPVTFAMHLSAAVESKHGLLNRPTVVVAGGREPAQWEAYPHHRYLSNNGALPCCADGGCWKSRCTTVGDGDPKDKDLCVNPVDTGQKVMFTRSDGEEGVNSQQSDLKIAKCLDMIKPAHVIEAIESYYEGGILDFE